MIIVKIIKYTSRSKYNMLRAARKKNCISIKYNNIKGVANKNRNEIKLVKIKFL